MENILPSYRLKSGKIKFNDNLSLDFIIGLVFNTDGNISIEVHFDEIIDLNQFYQKHIQLFQKTEYTLICKTEDGSIFTASNIFLKSFHFSKSRADFYCNGYIKIEKQNRDKREIEISSNTSSSPIKYIKVEGLKMLHSSHTYIKERRTYGPVYPMGIVRDKLWDHSEVFLKINNINYKFIINKENDGYTIIEFQDPTSDYQEMNYELWKNIKVDFTSFLSFLNGAPIFIRSEYYGEYYTIGNIDSQTIKIYSANYHQPKRWNEYIPINNGFNRSENLVPNAFINYFENYRQLNNLLDLNTIIFYLNNAEQASSIGERIFIQTILLERLSDKYSELFKDKETYIIEPTEYEIINKQLNRVLIKHQKILGENFNTINSKLNNLNNTKRKQTDYKFRELIKYAKIELTDEINNLLISRHTIIHAGDIGEPIDSVQNYILMDELLRKIIINLVRLHPKTN